MIAQIAIIHGWSATYKDLFEVRNFLSANGRAATDLWLGDYISLDDDVRVEDVAKRMQTVIEETIAAGKLRVPFDLIVHSTGGLVAREWVMTFHRGGTTCPAKRIIMLAPANFGSKLASSGKSLVGRVLKGWNNWFHTGRQMLNDLELASPYQWGLARRDLLAAPGEEASGPYGPGKIWPFVIVGTQGYTDGLRRIVNENGADGTVRVPAANLNTVGLTIDFTGAGGTQPELIPWSSRVGFDRIPLAVLPGRNHATILQPEVAVSGDDGLGALILAALDCGSDAAYAAMASDWKEITDRTGRLGDLGGGEAYHQYMQAIVRVVDDHERPVNDYFLEFFDPSRKGGRSDDDDDTVFFQRQVLEDVHTNDTAPSYRCLYIDRTDLSERFYKENNAKELAMSISAAPIGENIRYFDKDQKGAKGSVTIHRDNLDLVETLRGARLHRNTTHLIEIKIPRQPIDKVFRFI